MHEQLSNMSASPLPKDNIRSPNLDNDEFVDRFAKINVCKTHSAKILLQLHRIAIAEISHHASGSTMVFNSTSKLQAHQGHVHKGFDKPRLCPLHEKSCNLPENLYEKYANLYAHLRSAHKQTAQQIQLYIPILESARQPPKE